MVRIHLVPPVYFLLLFSYNRVIVLVVQGIEQQPSKLWVAGSNPAEDARFRKRGRVVDRTCLENKQTLTGHVGSNPTASAKF